MGEGVSCFALFEDISKGNDKEPSPYRFVGWTPTGSTVGMSCPSMA